ncbi:MAG: hypothetical protein ABI165_05125 [Bryobacteraceae bacterium]
MRAEVRLLCLKELLSYLRKYMDLPKLNIPAFSLPGEVHDQGECLPCLRLPGS